MSWISAPESHHVVACIKSVMLRALSALSVFHSRTLEHSPGGVSGNTLSIRARMTRFFSRRWALGRLRTTVISSDIVCFSLGCALLWVVVSVYGHAAVPRAATDFGELAVQRPDSCVLYVDACVHITHTFVQVFVVHFQVADCVALVRVFVA